MFLLVYYFVILTFSLHPLRSLQLIAHYLLFILNSSFLILNSSPRLLMKSCQRTSTEVEIEKTDEISIYRCRCVSNRIKIDFAAIIAVLMCVFSLILLFPCCFCYENCKLLGNLFSYCLFFNFKVWCFSVCVVFCSYFAK